MIEYKPTFNRVKKITDALTQITEFTYDSANGNLLTTKDPLNHVTTIAYNSFGQPTSVQGPIATEPPTTFIYDANGNLITTTDPLGNATQRAYDAVSRLISLTDPRGLFTQFRYDNLNRVTEIADARHGLTAFSYDPNGNLLTVADAKNQTTTYTYDNMDRLGTRKDALNRTETYQYDPAGNLTQFIDRKSQQSTFTYDALNRRMSASYQDSSNTAFTYDAAGWLTRTTDSISGAIDFAYDNLDRLILELTSQGAVQYAYDAIGRRTTMTVAGQVPVSYQYDAASRLVQVQQGTQTVGLGYDAADRRTSLTYPNGTSTTYTYDNASRLTRILHQGPSAVVDDLTYTYDAAGNRISLTRANGTASNLPAAVQAAYDAANEQIQFNSGTPNLTYDANGNLTTQADATGTTTYTWDARNWLTTINGPGVSASFSYDALGRRVSKTVNGVTTQFVYDGKDIVQEIGGSAVGASYMRSLNIDEVFGILRQDGAYFSIYDGLGSTLALTNASASSVLQYSYEPFGNTQSTNPAFANPFQFTGRENDGTGLYYYRARYYSPPMSRFLTEDPLYSPLFRAAKCQKNYAPDASNYVKSDRPLGLLLMFRFYRIRGVLAANPQKIPLYTYAENNPVNKFDPLGLISGPQNLGCDFVPDFLEGRCTVQCCNEHDDCYKRRRSFCDFTSWLDVGARLTRPDCLSCNRAVVQCIARNVFKGRKDLCDLTDF